MKRYGYHRTSTREQHLDRGIKEITAYCEQNSLELEKIFTDQQTGKNFNRPRYQVLKEDDGTCQLKILLYHRISYSISIKMIWKYDSEGRQTIHQRQYDKA